MSRASNIAAFILGGLIALFLLTALAFSLRIELATLQLLQHLLTGWWTARFPILLDPMARVMGLVLPLALVVAIVAFRKPLLRYSGCSYWRFADISLPLILLMALTAGTLSVSTLIKEGTLLLQEGLVSPDPQGRGPVTRSIVQARMLVTALRIYADEHNGRQPHRLEELADVQVLEPEFLANIRQVWSESRTWVDIVYLHAQEGKVPDDLPVLISPQPVAKGRHLVAYHNARVALVEDAEYETAMQRWWQYQAQVATNRIQVKDVATAVPDEGGPP